MDEWTINFSPGSYACDCCKYEVDAGYMLGQHPNWPKDWMCLSCVLATVRNDIRNKAIGRG